MNYRSVELPIDFETARQQISERVSGISVSTSPDSVEYRTPSGFHLATLSKITLPNGDRGVRLKYRTAIISASAARVRRKAAEIRSAIDSLQYRESRG